MFSNVSINIKLPLAPCCIHVADLPKHTPFPPSLRVRGLMTLILRNRVEGKRKEREREIEHLVMDTTNGPHASNKPIGVTAINGVPREKESERDNMTRRQNRIYKDILDWNTHQHLSFKVMAVWSATAGEGVHSRIFLAQYIRRYPCNLPCSHCHSHSLTHKHNK